MERLNRRELLRFLGVSTVALSLSELMAACGGSAGVATPTAASGSASSPLVTAPATTGIAVYAGDQATVQKQVWAAAIESKYKTRATIDDNTTTAKNLATITAQKGQQSLSIVMMEEPALKQAAAAGLLSKLDRSQMPSLKDVPDWALYEDGYGMAFSISFMSIQYNAKYVPEITSWMDLLKPEFKGKVIIPTITFAAAPFLLIMGGLALMGSQVGPTTKLDMKQVTDQGWEYLKRLKPQLKGIDSQVGPAFDQLAAGEAWVYAPSYAKYSAPYRSKGFDLRSALPKEGAFVGYNTAAVVRGGPAESIASGMIDLLIAPEFQTANAKQAFVGPVNTKVQVDASLKSVVPAAGDLASNVAPQSIVDYDFIAANQAQWVQRFNAEIVG